MTTNLVNRLLHSLNSTDPGAWHRHRTDNIDELPNFAKIAIITSIVILALLGVVPVIAFIYGCARRERLIQAAEERRRHRLNQFLANFSPIVEDEGTPWQKKVRSIARDMVEDVLCSLMHLFTWVSETQPSNDVSAQESPTKIVPTDNKLTEISTEKKSSLDLENNNYCAICISQFEDGDQVVQSCVGTHSNNSSDGKRGVTDAYLCVHRFHKNCMVEWLQLANEPVCPYCRRDYLDEGKMVEEGLAFDNNTNGTNVASQMQQTLGSPSSNNDL